MRYAFKVAAVIVMHGVTWPFALPARFGYRMGGSERAFDFSAKLLSLAPGRLGQLLRASFYMQTLDRCHYDLSVGFGSFFSHPCAEVGRRVGIGSFSIIGMVRLGDDVMIASRVSVLSGKYQHGDGRHGLARAPRFRRVHIGAGTWLGEGSLVMDDVGRGCIVAGGSVVTKAMPDGTTAIGNPARFLHHREQGEAAAV